MFSLRLVSRSSTFHSTSLKPFFSPRHFQFVQFCSNPLKEFENETDSPPEQNPSRQFQDAIVTVGHIPNNATRSKSTMSINVEKAIAFGRSVQQMLDEQKLQNEREYQELKSNIEFLEDPLYHFEKSDQNGSIYHDIDENLSKQIDQQLNNLNIDQTSATTLEEIFNQNKSGISHHHIQILLQKYVDQGDLESLKNCFKNLKDSWGLGPGSEIYRVVIEGYARLSSGSEALELLESMNQADEPILPILKHYNPVLAAFSREENPLKIKELFETMRKRLISPSEDSYYYYAQALAKKKDVYGLRNLKQQMETLEFDTRQVKELYDDLRIECLV